MAKKKRSAKKASDGERSPGDLCAEIRRKLAIGKASYQAADKLVAKLRELGKLRHGAKLTASDGRRYRVRDLFRGVDKMFRTTAVARWEIERDE